MFVWLLYTLPSQRTFLPPERDSNSALQCVHFGRTNRSLFAMRTCRLRGDKPSSPTLSPETAAQVRTLLLFVGYPRSCHSLVGALLDAHPNIVVAHEYNLFVRWSSWSSRKKTNRTFVLNELFQKSVSDADRGVRSRVPGTASARQKPHTYFYGVPDEWQGAFDRRLLVIGDKRGALTSLFVARQGKGKGLDTLKELAGDIGLPLRFVHVVRNPYDNIATILLRKVQKRDPAGQGPVEKVELHPEQQTKTVRRFFDRLVKTVEKVRLHYPVVDVHCEELIARPKVVLRQLCAYLDVPCSERYLADCSGIINKRPSKTRHLIHWPPKVLDEIQSECKKHKFLRNYTFEN